jgi:site-specific recombinase XerD
MLRRAFEFGYRDHPDHANPAWVLKGARIRRRDLPRIDPFRIQDAEALIAAIHQDWGEVQGNFHELRFFTGLRPSEEIALKERDFDKVRGTLSVTKARVYGVDKDTTKTHEDRVIQLCPRAIAVLSRQRALRRHLKSRGRIDHDQLFFRHDGAPIRALGYLAKCWRKSSERLDLRFRRPYCARHTSVSWNLMIGKNPLFVSRQHGHSVTTMWRTYAAWMDGALETDIALVQAAMNRDGRAIERVSNTQIELTVNAPAVAGLGTRLATRRQAPEAQVPDTKGPKKWRRGWDCSRPGTAARPPLRSGPTRARRPKSLQAILSNPRKQSLKSKCYWKIGGYLSPQNPSPPRLCQ